MLTKCRSLNILVELIIFLNYSFFVFNRSSKYFVPCSGYKYESDASATRKIQLNDHGKVIGRVDVFCRPVPG
jgi:hypothetical protein